MRHIVHRISKFSAARGQLDTAIELWFLDKDPASIHILAFHSHEMLHKFYRQAGHSDLLFDTSAIEESMRTSFVKKIKETPNFIKHANDTRELDPSFTTEIRDYDSITLLLMSVTALQRMGFALSQPEAAMLLWVVVHFPEYFGDDISRYAQLNFPIDKARKVSKSNFLKNLNVIFGGEVARAFGGTR